MKTLSDQCATALREWLEDVCFGLISNGVPWKDILIKDNDSVGRCDVLVKGVLKYRFQVSIEKFLAGELVIEKT